MGRSTIKGLRNRIRSAAAPQGDRYRIRNRIPGAYGGDVWAGSGEFPSYMAAPKGRLGRARGAGKEGDRVSGTAIVQGVPLEGARQSLAYPWERFSDISCPVRYPVCRSEEHRLNSSH